MAKLGKLEKIDLRTAWKNEAKDFTTWLAEDENLAILSDEIGIGIKLVRTEADVGKYSVDILAEDEDNPEHKIIIENQLEKTNHDHLGKIITYASGCDAKTIIWIAAKFQDEHKQAIHWLNERTDEDTRFFGIEMELWKIGDSEPAPKFSIVAQPNDWAKEMKMSVANRSVSDTKLKQQLFWSGLIQFAKERKTLLSMRKSRPQHWYDIAIGDSRVHLSLVANLQEGKIECQLYIPDDKHLFNSLFENRKESIDKELPYKLDWQPLGNKKACRITTIKSMDFNNEAAWPRSFEWLLDAAECFAKTFGKYIKQVS